MKTMNQRTAQVMDPILSTHSRGYRNSKFVSHLIAPRVTIPNRSAKVLQFGKDDFRTMNTERAPGAHKKRIEFGFGTETVALDQHALEGSTPVEHQEEAEKIPGVDLGRGAINRVLATIDLGLEVQVAKMVRNPASFGTNNKVTLTGNQRWTASESDPEEDIDAAKDAVRRMIGQDPNTLTVGPTAFRALKRHPKIKAQFKYTSSRSITVDMLKEFFELEQLIVGKATYRTENMTDEQPAIDIWGDDAILSYTPLEDVEYGSPAFAYTYELRGYPQVMEPYFENQSDTWVYPFKAERRPYLVGAESGFLFQNAGNRG